MGESNRSCQSNIKPQMQREPSIGITAQKENISENMSCHSNQQQHEKSRMSECKKQEKSEEENMITDIKYKLKKVFIFYTSFGDRFNSTMLKSNKFHKMMNDAGIRDA